MLENDINYLKDLFGELPASKAARGALTRIKKELAEIKKPSNNTERAVICSREICDYCKLYHEKKTCMECLGGGYKAFDGRKLTPLS